MNSWGHQARRRKKQSILSTSLQHDSTRSPIKPDKIRLKPKHVYTSSKFNYTLFSIRALCRRVDWGSCFGETRPNILFILADDMAWTSPSCYGGQNVATPNIDRLAKHGMRFTAGYADSQCSPTRAAFFSGQYGARSKGFKVIHEKEPPNAAMIPPEANLALQPDVASLALTMQKAGYATGISGKWHIADNYAAAVLREKENGKYFERYGFDFCGRAVRKILPKTKPSRLSPTISSASSKKTKIVRGLLARCTLLLTLSWPLRRP